MQWKHFSYTVRMEEVFRSYVVINGDGARRLRPNNNTLQQLHLRRWGKPYFCDADAGSRMATFTLLRPSGFEKPLNVFAGQPFKITPQGTLTSFSLDGTDGAIPDAGFLLGRNGLLYGTTSTGGASGNGEVFSLNSQTGAVTVQHLLAGSDGAAQRRLLRWGQAESITGVPPLVAPQLRNAVQHKTASHLQISPQLQRCGLGAKPWRDSPWDPMALFDASTYGVRPPTVRTISRAPSDPRVSPAPGFCPRPHREAVGEI